MLPIRPNPQETPLCPACQCLHFPYATLDGRLYWCDDSPADHGALASEERAERNRQRQLRADAEDREWRADKARKRAERNVSSWTAWNPDSPKPIKAENPTKGLLP